MARARNIKPAFFNNDLLAEIEPLGRLFFIGLWTISDYRGCLEWRPKRLKAQILPYDDCDIESIGINLDNSGFIRLYSVQGQMYAKIVNFSKHQNPHKNERSSGSSIPDFEEKHAKSTIVEQALDKSVKIAINPDNNGTDRADSLLPITDSLILNPESLCESKPVVQQAKRINPDLTEIFNHWCSVMSKNKSTTKFTDKRQKAVKARLKDGYSFADICLAITNCSQDAFSMGQNERHTAYNDLELILRTGEKLEHFRDALNQSQGITTKTIKTSNNVNVLQGFLNS